MSHDFLKPILGDELYAQFDQKVRAATGITLANVSDGSFIPKGKFDEQLEKAKILAQQNGELSTKLASHEKQVGELTTKLTAQEQQVGELTTKLTAQEHLVASATDLQQQVEQLQKDVTARDSQIKEQSMTYQIKEHLRGMKVRNPDVVMPLLKMGTITEKDGKLVGLTEQVDALRKTDGYLFDASQGARGGFSGGQDIATGQNNDVNAAVNDAIRALSGRAT